MAFTRYASAEYADVLDIKGSNNRIYTASLDKIAEYNDFRTDDNFLYVRIRAISSRINQNHDGWPTVELAGSPDILNKHHSADGFTIEAASGNPEYGFATFMNKPIFVDHHNGDPKKTRGMIVDAKFNVLTKEAAALDPYWSSREVDPAHLPASEIELLLEIDTKAYPKLANAVKLGHIDGFSMGCNVAHSICSHCGNKASSADQYCTHVKLKGMEHDYKTSSGERIRRKSYENVSGIQFFEISCFPAGTPISTPDGPKTIETIQVGDYVLDHQGDVKRVTGTMEKEFKGELVQISHWGHGNLLLEATPEHPILAIKDEDIPSDDKTQLDRRRKTLIKALENKTIEPQWTAAVDLSVNDWLYEVIPGDSLQRENLTNGKWIRIRKINKREFIGKVYNLEVEDTHTYVANNVAVHNCVFNPADATALTKEVYAAVQKESEFYNQFGQPDIDPLRGPKSDYLDGPLMQKGIMPPGDLAHDEGYENIPYGVSPNPRTERNFNEDEGLEIAPNVGFAGTNIHGLPMGAQPPVRQTPPGGIYDQELHGGPEAIPNQAVQNDPRWSATHTAENPLPQEMMVRAPDEIDTLRDESLCPVCSAEMTKETCAICFSPGTLIRTANGLQPIETIEVGDLVLSADGVLRPVAEVMISDYTGNLKKIDTPSLLEPILATPNHPFAVLVGDHGPQKTNPCRQSRCTRHANWKDNHHYAWQHAGCLTTDHYVVSNHLNNTIVDIDTIEIPSVYTDKQKHGQIRKGPKNFEINEDFLWSVGQYIAEGSAGTRRINFASHRNEIEYQNRLINYFESQGYSTKLIHKEDKPNSAWVDVNSSTLAEWFPRWLGRGSSNKKIPGELMNLPIEKLKHVYAGYLSGDGAHDYNSAKTTSPTLALQISEIGRRLGARPSIQTEYPENKLVTYTINNVLDKTSKRRSTQKNIKNTWMVDNHLLYRITSIEDVEYSGPVYNLRIEGNPTYTVQNILVHNCGFTKPPDKFDNPDLNKAQEIRNQFKQQEEQQAQPQPGQASPPTGDSNQQSTPMPTKQQPTANLNSRMSWTPLVTEKTAARINKVEKPVGNPNTIVTNQPQTNVVVGDQLSPVTSAMLTAQRLMAIAQLNKQGESMSNTKLADGATPPDGTSAKNRVDVVGVGGFDQASNEEASKAQAQIDVNGIGGTGVEGVDADSTDTLPTSDPKSDNSGFNTDKTTEDSGPTSTYGDSDGTEKAFTDPVTSVPFPASEDGVKAANAYHAAVKAAQELYLNQRVAYEDGTLEQQDQQGDPIAQGGSAVQGVKPIDSVATESYKRENVLEHKTTPSNNSGPTKTWSGTDGNGVNKQQDPVTKEEQQTGGVPTPDVKLHTGSIRISSIKLAELEIELGLPEHPKDEKYNRIAQLDQLDESFVLAQIEALSNVKTAGLAKLAQARTSGVTRVPSMFGKATSAPNGFERIANDHTASQQEPITDYALDSALFIK